MDCNNYCKISENISEKSPVLNTYPIVRCAAEERNFSDHHVTGIKEEYEDQSHDLTFEIKFEEDPVPISFPVVKREPEEEQSDLDTVNKEPRVEGTAGDNEIFTECIAVNGENLVPGCCDNIAQDEQQPADKELQRCDVCGKCFSGPVQLKSHASVHTGEAPFICDVCGKHFSLVENLRRHTNVHTGQRPFSCVVCGKNFTNRDISKSIQGDIQARSHSIAIFV
ncbi:uncharacterized protein [Periplaneta americana]|uniref:uncharacterized protein n=1 Tax=Periplaneta americana TaxID=6978 RepID=UPI0037E88E12